MHVAGQPVELGNDNRATSRGRSAYHSRAGRRMPRAGPEKAAGSFWSLGEAGGAEAVDKPFDHGHNYMSAPIHGLGPVVVHKVSWLSLDGFRPLSCANTTLTLRLAAVRKRRGSCISRWSLVRCERV
jgi:hypothetical protein